MKHCGDVLPEGKKIGGAPANFAYHVSQFGLDGRAVSAVGDDKLGAEILENFYEKNLHSMIEKSTVSHRYGSGRTGCRRSSLLRYKGRCGMG